MPASVAASARLAGVRADSSFFLLPGWRYILSVALRMSDVSGGCVNIDIGTMNGFSCKVEFSCKIAAK